MPLAISNVAIDFCHFLRASARGESAFRWFGSLYAPREGRCNCGREALDAHPVPVHLPGGRQSRRVPYRSRRARVVSQPPQTPRHSSRICFRSRLDGPLYPNGYRRMAGLARLWLARRPLGIAALFRATRPQYGLVGNFLRRTSARRGVWWDLDTLAGHPVQHRGVPLAYAHRCVAARPLPAVGHVCQLSQLRSVVAESPLRVNGHRPFDAAENARLKYELRFSRGIWRGHFVYPGLLAAGPAFLPH